MCRILRCDFPNALHDVGDEATSAGQRRDCLRILNGVDTNTRERDEAHSSATARPERGTPLHCEPAKGRRAKMTRESQ